MTMHSTDRATLRELRNAMLNFARIRTRHGGAMPGGSTTVSKQGSRLFLCALLPGVNWRN